MVRPPGVLTRFNRVRPSGLGLTIVLAVSWLAAAAFALWTRALWMRAGRIGPAPDVVPGGGDSG